jgi:hypothetical protein
MFYLALGSDLPLGPAAAALINAYHETIDLRPCSQNGNCLYGKSLQDILLGERALGVGVLVNRSPSNTWGDWVRLGFKGGVFISPLDWPTMKGC